MKFKKKMLSVILSISMLAGLLPATVQAEGAKNPLSASATEVSKGETLTVSFVQQETVENVGGIEAGITFDKEVFEATKVTSVSYEGTDSPLVTSPEEANEAGAAAVSITNVNQNTTVEEGTKLITIELKVKDSAKTGDTTFGIDTYELRNDGDITPAIDESGVIVKIKDATPEPSEKVNPLSATKAEVNAGDEFEVSFKQPT